MSDPMTELQSRTMEQLDVLRNVPSRIVQSTASLPMRFVNCDIPSADIGFVYLAISTMNPHIAKVRVCKNIKEDIDALNCPTAPATDTSDLPYAIVAFIYGFIGDVGSDVGEDHRARVYRFMSSNADRSMDLRNRMQYWRELFGSLDDENFVNNEIDKLLLYKECYAMNNAD